MGWYLEEASSIQYWVGTRFTLREGRAGRGCEVGGRGV